MTAPEYRFLACNALTNAVLEELPLVGVDFLRVLNAAGSFGGNLPLDGVASTRAAQLLSASEPDAITLYVQRGGSFLWGGLLTSHGYDSDTGMLSITAAEYGSYLDDRYIVANDPAGAAHTGDISTLAQNFAQTVFADQGPPLIVSVRASGVTTTMTFNAWEPHKVADLLQSLSTMAPGFDWAFDAVADVNGNPVIQLTISAPRRGASIVSSGIVFDYPGGNATKYALTKDGKKFASDVILTGAGSGNTLLTTEAQTAAPPYVKMTAVVSNRDITAQDQLLSIAAATAAARGGSPPLIHTLTVRGSAAYDQGLGIGDEFTFVVQPGDPYYSSGATVPLRAIQLHTYPATDTTQELVDVVTGPPV